MSRPVSRRRLFASYQNLDVENNEALEAAAEGAKEMVLKAKMPAAIRDDIKKAYKKMSEKDLIVAVRSSATAEDLPDASFAGQQDTYLNIKGEAALIESVQKCWASLYGARAIYYRAKQGFDDHTVNIAVVVQQLVHSEKAGVMFTSHPITGEPRSIIEGSWGLGEAVVSGTVSPDNYVFDQKTEKVVDVFIANKKVEIIADGDHGTKVVDVIGARQDARVLSEAEIAKLAMYGKIAEDHYGIPQDVEWGIVGGTIYILQSRPITTIGNKKEARNMTEEHKPGAKLLLKGQGAAPGIASGKVVIIRDVRDVGKVKEGDILVTKMTNPDMVPAMRKVAAIVTDEGGMTCHAAIVSRELGTPAIVGTKNATNLLKNDQLVTVDGEKGHIYEGIIATAAPAQAAVQQVAVAPRTDHHRNEREGQCLHPRSSKTGSSHRCRRCRPPPDRAPHPRPEQDPRLVHRQPQGRGVRDRTPRRDQDRARCLPGQAGLGADARCPDGRVPEHAGWRERTPRAQPDARLERHPPRPRVPGPVPAPGRVLQAPLEGGLRQPRYHVPDGLPPRPVHSGQEP